MLGQSVAYVYTSRDQRCSTSVIEPVFATWCGHGPLVNFTMIWRNSTIRCFFSTTLVVVTMNAAGVSDLDLDQRQS